ncbi:hybrid sensor histidine kinase/response regulator transcription factor [Gaetbulibacter aestuarii]|uniref:histidine kinase n=1 Tax=Gaetbulibacter aestuarii TaxID=1502358 RepID=A0ABW7MWT7_9FLAO
MSFAQNTVEFKQLSGENVSTQSITYAVVQDSIGNVWIASEEGVLKHNSKFYKVYNTYNGLPSSVSNRTMDIFIDSKQRIWAGMENGICLYDNTLDRFNLVGKTPDINPSLVNEIIEDDQGNIWIACYNGLWKYNPNGKEDTLVRLISNHVLYSIYYLEHQIFVGASDGLYVYDIKSDILSPVSSDIKNVDLINKANNALFVGTKSGKIFTLNPTGNILKPLDFKNPGHYPISDICNDDLGNIYLATDGDGLYYLDRNFNVLNHFVDDIDDKNSISSNGIYDVEIGNEGILWLATYGGGVNYFNSYRLPFNKIQHRINNENSLVTNFTRSIAIDKNNKLWFGTKKGVSIWNPKTNTWKHLNDFSGPGSSDNVVLALAADDEYMWMGTYNSGLLRVNINTFRITKFDSKKSEKLQLKKVYTVCKDSHNNIWFGGIQGDVTVIRSNGKIDTYPIQPVKSIIESNSGDIIAAGKNGAFRINPNKSRFELIEGTRPTPQSRAYSNINALAQLNNGTLLLATNGTGLMFYDLNSQQCKKLDMRSGLPSDIIQGVIVQDNNNIWASTTKGLAHIKTSAKDTIINIYDKRDGLACTEFNYGSFAKLKDSLFAFGGVDGVTTYNPYEIKGHNYKPAVVFDKFRLFNKDVDPGDSKILQKHINVTKNITLKSSENSIQLAFTGISHGTPSKIKYSWQLEGFDPDWSTPSHNAFATYTNLSSGTYTFKVKAADKYGNFGKARTINITVLSPWWATNEAIFVYVLIILGVILLIIHFTSVIVNKRNADEQIDMFNNITHEIKTPLTILLSSLDNATEKAKHDIPKDQIKTTVKRISSLFEQMLNFHKVTTDKSGKSYVSPINLEKHIQKIVSDFNPLFEDHNLKIEIRNKWTNELFYYNKETFDKVVLNLISNAIKYSFDDNKIIIELDKTKSGELKLKVIDFGMGIPKDQQKYILKRYYRARNVINSQRPGTGLGLIMIKKLIEKNGGSIQFESQENRGTTFTVVLKNFKARHQHQETNSEKIQIQGDILIEHEDPSELAELSDNKILIVEDNDELRNILVESLGTHFQVFEAHNGEEGLKMAMQNFPDLILTDLIMPEMDGIEMSKRIKNDINLNHIPIFMLTVLQNSVQKLESIESGISEYIEKPINMPFLLAKIVNTFKWQQKLREKYVHETDADNAASFRNENDQKFLEDLEESVLQNIENNNFSVHDLSNIFGMSRTSLYMKLKSLVDLSPQDFIIHTKLKLAKKLLIQGDKSIKEVAYASGFSNPKYFSTSFKKFYGQTPTGFVDSLQD